MTTLKAKVILNVKTAAEWANSTEVLLEGELGIESDTRLIKVGNGVDTYINLPYTAASDINDIEGVTVTNPTDGDVLTYSNGEWVNITPSALPADTDLSHYDNSTSGFITASDIPALPANTDLSQYDNTNSDFATVSQIPTDVSQLNNDAGYITSADLPTVGDGTITIQANSINVDSFTTNQNINKTINITIPTNVSELNNDAGYITSATVPTVNDGTLIIRQDGNAIATFTANSATNVVADITSPSLSGYLALTGGEMTGNITVSGSHTLGNSTQEWSTVYTGQVQANSNTLYVGGNDSSIFYFIPTSTASKNLLGSPTNSWEAAYIDKFIASSGNTDVYFDTNVLPNASTYTLGGANNYWSGVYSTQVHLSSNVFLQTAASGQAGEFYWYNSDASASAAMQLVGSCVRAFSGSGGTIDLGSQGIRWRTVYYTTLNPSSDIRLKDNIEPLESGLKIVNDLDIKSFTYKSSPDHIEYGIIAQDVVDKYPELISVPDSEDGAYGTYLHNFIFASLRAIQELSSKVDELNAKIKVLEGRV